jgi:predicted glycoside hydrolase/deacetylase ChbG (UPF0249 family)/glycosyltransferase involved in cell wall biosynthesis
MMFLETSDQRGVHEDRQPERHVASLPEACDWTIIVPFFNEAGYLPATLRSIAALEGPFRLVLVDNGSTDGSGDIARRVCDDLRRPFTLIVEPCPGKVHALRAGLAQVRTRFVATCDADTHYPPHYLAAAGRLLDKPGVVVAGAYFTHSQQWARRDAFTGAHIVAAGKLLSHQCHAGGAGQVFNTEVLRRAGGFDANRWNLVLEDHEIIHRVGQHGRMAYGVDFWCHPSPRDRDRDSIRWTLYERLHYHFTPRGKQGRFFYDFLARRLRARKLSSQRIRERQFQEDEAAEPASNQAGRLVICADDFGLTTAISRSIVALAGQGKLNAISCMSVCPGWASDAALLRLLPESVQIGLHVTLTEEVPLTSMPILAWNGRMPASSELEKRALVRRLPLGEIRREVAAQFDRFVDVFGRPPAFVDAHQHVHVLRGIREIIMAETARRAPGAWVRSCVDRPSAIFARCFPVKAMINSMQSRGVRRAASHHGLKCNDSFAGFYDFSSDYRKLFPQFLDRPGQFHLIMCHPGGGHDQADVIARARRDEAAALRAMPIHEMAAARGLHFEAATPMR